MNKSITGLVTILVSFGAGVYAGWYIRDKKAKEEFKEVRKEYKDLEEKTKLSLNKLYGAPSSQINDDVTAAAIDGTSAVDNPEEVAKIATPGNKRDDRSLKEIAESYKKPDLTKLGAYTPDEPTTSEIVEAADSIASKYRTGVKEEMTAEEYNAMLEQENDELYPEPVRIDPDFYGENPNWGTCSLIYFAGDGQVAFDPATEDEKEMQLVDDVETTVGLENLNHFGEYMDGLVHVRNPEHKTDYEISYDERTYAEAFESFKEEAVANA